MAQNLSTAELDAILEAPRTAPRPGSGVSARDFSQPRRLSSAQLEHVRRQACKALPALETLLRTSLRSPHKVEVTHVTEVDARALARDLALPFAVARFECAGHASWAVWDGAACVATTEVVLGAAQAPQEPQTPARKLTSVETGVAERWIARVIAAFTAGFGFEATKLRLAQTHDDLALEVDLPRGKDSQRIALTLSIEGATGTSMLRVLLAGLKVPDDAPSAKASPKKLASLPAHLHDVKVELSARLGSAQIPLADVLALEIGDVIPLGAESASVLEVFVQGHACATARLGQDDGRMALRIESTSLPAHVRP